MKTAIMAFAAIQVVLYFFSVFIAWEFWWFLRFDDWSPGDRASILIIWVFTSAALTLSAIAINEGFK